MDHPHRSLSLDLFAGEFVARYTNHHGIIVEKRFNRNDPETIYKITEHWREVERLHKQHINELNKKKSNENDLNNVQ